MPFIRVQRKCAICEKEHDILVAEKDYGSYNGVLLSDIVFCADCRERLKKLLYQEGECEVQSAD